MNPKSNNKMSNFLSQQYSKNTILKIEIEDNNPKRFELVQYRLVKCQKCQFDWIRLAMFLKYLQEVSDTTNSRRPLTMCMGILDPWNMQNLLQSNQHLYLTYYQSPPLCQNNFGPRKSNLHLLFFQNLFIRKKYFLYTLFFARLGPRNKKMMLILQSK